MKNSMNSNSPPKICVLLESYYPDVGGMATQAKLLAEEWKSFGLSVFIITRQKQIDYKKKELVNDIPIFRVSPVGDWHLNRWLMIAPSLLLLIKMRHNYDIIFVSGFRTLGIPAVIVSKIFSKKCILRAANNGELSGEYFNYGIQKMNLSSIAAAIRVFLNVRKWILTKANYFVVISSKIEDELIKNQVSPDKIIEIFNGVDTSKFCPVAPDKKLSLRSKLGIPKDKIIVTYTGMLVSWKGLPQLIQVWKKICVKHSNVYLIFIGEGRGIHSCELELKTFVKDNYLEEKVKFTGNVINTYEYLQSSDIFVFPSVDDGFSNSLIEALSCNLPVIVTSNAKDIIKNGENGLIIDININGDFYKAFDTLITNYSLRISMGKLSRDIAKEKYSIINTSRKYIDLFLHIYH